jgi:hypothetical protein
MTSRNAAPLARKLFIGLPAFHGPLTVVLANTIEREEKMLVAFKYLRTE